MYPNFYLIILELFDHAQIFVLEKYTVRHSETFSLNRRSKLTSGGTQGPPLRGNKSPSCMKNLGSTKQILDINDFLRLVLVYKRDFLYTTNMTKMTEIKESMLKVH
jgi:hypothetical protein